MKRIDTPTPPVFKVVDGKAFVVVITPDGDEIWAPVGPHFVSRIFELWVLPRLRG